MKIGVLGSGDVAKALAGGLLKHGHDVTLGTRNPDKLADWRKIHHTAQIADFAAAAGYGELVILAVKGAAALDVLRLAGAANLSGKTVIDVTNPAGEWRAEVLYQSG